MYEDVTIHDRGFGHNLLVTDRLKSESHQSDPFWLEAAKRYQGGPPVTQHTTSVTITVEYIGTDGFTVVVPVMFELGPVRPSRENLFF